MARATRRLDLALSVEHAGVECRLGFAGRILRPITSLFFCRLGMAGMRRLLMGLKCACSFFAVLLRNIFPYVLG